MPTHHRVHPSGLAEVAQFDPREIAPEHENIVQLDVTVHQLATVNMMHRCSQLSDYPFRVKLAEPSLRYVGR